MILTEFEYVIYIKGYSISNSVILYITIFIINAYLKNAWI